MGTEKLDLKEELSVQAQQGGGTEPVRLKKNMTIADMIKAMEPEIRRALPASITAERFTRVALSSLNTTPDLASCTPMSFLAGLLNAAQLGLEVNSPLQQAFLIPFRNKGVLECQFQVGYRGLLDLAFRNENMQTIQAHVVYEHDEFEYSYGLNGTLYHRPSLSERGEPVFFYAYFKLSNGGYGYSVMSREEMDLHAQKYSKGFGSGFSPWKNNYESMALKTVIKKALKYAPIKTEFQRALSTDGSIKSKLSIDMSEVANEYAYEE